jgi:hypothetical protein
MTSVLTTEKQNVHSLQTPSVRIPHPTGSSSGAGKHNTQTSPSGSPSVRKKTSATAGNNITVKPIPVLSVSSFYELSANMPNGKMDHFEKHHGKVTLVVNMASCDKNTKHELSQVTSHLFLLFFIIHRIKVATLSCDVMRFCKLKRFIFEMYIWCITIGIV